MAKLTEFVKKGVRLIVTDTTTSDGAEAATTTREIPGETLTPQQPPDASATRLPAGTDFSDVYREAGIQQPGHGYGIDKVAEMLDNKRLATLTREVRATAVVTALEAAGVQLTEVIQDAVRRDQALDAFEAAKRRDLETLKTENQKRVAAIQQEIEAFLRGKNNEIEELKRGTEAAVEAFAQLEARKHREEERLRDIVCYFVTPQDNPITTATQSKTPPEPE